MAIIDMPKGFESYFLNFDRNKLLPYGTLPFRPAMSIFVIGPYLEKSTATTFGATRISWSEMGRVHQQGVMTTRIASPHNLLIMYGMYQNKLSEVQGKWPK